VACAVLVAPLLVIFSVLGAKYPTAGGVAGFLQNAFSRDIGAATEVLLLGTFGLGIPAIALTGSYYLLSIFTTSPSDLSILAVSIGAVGVAFVVNYFGVSTSGNVQKYLAITLTSAIFVIAIVSIVLAGTHSAFDGEGLSPLRSVDTEAISSLVGTIFFDDRGIPKSKARLPSGSGTELCRCRRTVLPSGPGHTADRATE
jgi:amino acid transporter